MREDKNTNKKSFAGALFSNLFGMGKAVDKSILEEEDVQSPFRTVISTYRSNRISMVALVIFVIIFLIVTIGPVIFPIDLSFSDSSQQNVAPGRDMMMVPEALKKDIKDIEVGPTFSVGLSNSGEAYVWGKTRISGTIDVSELPKNIDELGKLDKIAAGYDHVVALTEDGELVGWGSNRQQQLGFTMGSSIGKVKDIYASYQNTLILTEDGHVEYFGNNMNTDYNNGHEYQGEIEKIATSSDGVLGLTKSGEAVYLGSQPNSYSKVPTGLGKIVDIACTSSTMAAVDENGEVKIWGNFSNKGENKVPELEGEKIVSIKGGRSHYVAQTDKGNIYSWGSDFYKQSIIPEEVKNKPVRDYFTGFFQNYVVTEDNELVTWGLKGYTLGSDDLGRDILGRLLNGGRMSMTIGAVAVIISTVIGVVIGGVSGYFGGKVDHILQRISEMVNSLPFLPFAMILSSLIGNRLPTKQKTYMLMVILGLLSWPGLQRLVRAQVLAVREEEYVVAAQALGIKRKHIIFRHILPNVISVVIVSATLSFGTSMLTESTLSYLGFGVQAPQPTWGNMLFGANDSVVIQYYWWRWVYASIILGICVICINLIGEGLRAAIDPKSQER